MKHITKLIQHNHIHYVRPNKHHPASSIRNGTDGLTCNLLGPHRTTLKGTPETVVSPLKVKQEIVIGAQHRSETVCQLNHRHRKSA